MTTTMLLILIAISTSAVSAEGQQGHSNGYNYPKPTPAFNGYDYPKPPKPFHEGYTYNTPKCPLVLPSTSTVTDYKTIVSSSFVTETQTLPPITSTSFTTSFVTLPPDVVTQTDTSTLFFTFTSTEFSVSTTTEIQPTTVTSLITTTYCQPNTYLPPPPPTPPPNTYLPVDPPSKEYLPQRPPQAPQTNVATGTSTVVRQSTESSGNQGGFISTFVQQQSGPIKRATAGNPSRLEPLSSERVEANEVIPGEESSQPSINIIYIDRHGVSEGKPPAGLMNWLLCKFNLSSGSCSDN